MCARRAVTHPLRIFKVIFLLLVTLHSGFGEKDVCARRAVTHPGQIFAPCKICTSAILGGRALFGIHASEGLAHTPFSPKPSSVVSFELKKGEALQLIDKSKAEH